jgi:hypothetical protein
VDSDSTEWSSLVSALEALRKEIRSHSAATVGRQDTRDHAKSVVQQYFRSTRRHLTDLDFSDEELSPLDEQMQELLRLANGVSARTDYVRVVRNAKKLLDQVEVNREMRLGLSERTTDSAAPGGVPSQIEKSIIRTLGGLAPGAALGYEQAVRDIQDPDRLSYRGVASELREVVREVLDRLASDKDLEDAGTKVEKGQSGFTQKQKVRHILQSRGLARNARKAPEDSIRLIEELTGSLTRSVYVRGSISTHVSSPRAEVQQLKMYVDGVVAELLEIHRQPGG